MEGADWILPFVSFKLTKVQTPEILGGAFHVNESSVHEHGRAEHHGAVALPVGRHLGLHTERERNTFRIDGKLLLWPWLNSHKKCIKFGLLQPNPNLSLPTLVILFLLSYMYIHSVGKHCKSIYLTFKVLTNIWVVCDFCSADTS